MTKWHVTELSKLYRCLLKDVGIAFPTLRCEFERDLARLQDSVKHRGIHALVVDLPAAGKHLDMCLASGVYKVSGLPLTGRVSGTVVIPKLFRGLYLLIFTESGSLKEDYNHEAILCLRQLLYAAKKAELPCSAEVLDREVLEFFSTDVELPTPHGWWNSVSTVNDEIEATYRGFSQDVFFNRQIPENVDVEQDASLDISRLLGMVDRVSAILSATLGPYRSSEWRFRHGPGAVSESTGPKNKYSWTNWSNRLESSFPIADVGYHSYAAWAAASTTTDVSSHEPASRMVSVPKTISAPRLIAAEPSENQWCQQNIWHYFRERTKKTWINDFVRFTDQSLNQELCLKGSVDGSLATVDLSSASDRVSCEAVGHLFRSNPSLLTALRSVRTQYITQRVSRKGPSERVALNKYSTMGSACTFPVQSMLFVTVALAATLHSRGLQVTESNIRRLEGSVSVFGDDIIVPVESRVPFERIMKALCLRINPKKTFWTGLFRESCGVDAIGGESVTPAYWKKPCNGGPESVASTIAMSNNFYKKWFINTAAHLASTIPRNHKIARVSMDSGICGFKSFVDWSDQNRSVRFNQDLQRMEARVLVISTSSVRTSITDDSGLLQWFTEDPPPTTEWKNGFDSRPHSKNRMGWVPSQELARSAPLEVGHG